MRTVDLGKRYYIGGERRAYRTLRDTLVQTALRSIERIRHPGAATHVSEELWALRDINLEVEHGEALGIIGRNGSGKSTLLKILSHITQPTAGKAEIRGRVGCLLEVGTGFHPELTGRENIQLSGAIMGMTRAEIRAKFDEIVEFSQISRFLDTPVKRYSSGMYIRLAFSVAAHLNLDVLVVDEVLAVGDADFQRKCLGRMDQVAHEGRTVLFVSHNMASVRNLCTRAVQLEAGRIVRAGSAEEVTDGYLQGSLTARSLDTIENALKALPQGPAFRLHGVEIRQGGVPTLHLLNGQPVEIKCLYSVSEPCRALRVFFDLLDDDFDVLFRSHHNDQEPMITTVQPGEYVSSAIIPADLLAPRNYRLRVALHQGTWWKKTGDGEGILIPVTVEATSGVNQLFGDIIRWKLQPRIHWETRQISRGKSPEEDGG